MEPKRRTFELLDHVTRCCGVRLLEQATPSVVTPGGNPVYMCSLCGKRASSMMPDVLCWCGQVFRGQREQAFRCVPMAGASEALRKELSRNGYTKLDDFGVGVISRDFKEPTQ